MVPKNGAVAFTDPIMGLIADRTNTRWGKFRPYILFGAIPYGICGYLMFAGPDLSTNGKILYAFITYALMLTSYSVINVPYSSLLGVVSASSRRARWRRASGSWARLPVGCSYRCSSGLS